jgi:hypothetical protein
MDTRHAGAAVEESKKNDENPRVQRESQDRAGKRKTDPPAKRNDVGTSAHRNRLPPTA